MSNKRISALEWESKVNTISLSKQYQKHLDILNSDSIQTILDNERETNEICFLCNFIGSTMGLDGDLRAAFFCAGIILHVHRFHSRDHHRIDPGYRSAH